MNEKLDRFHKYLELYEKLVLANASNFVDDCLAEDVSQDTFEKMYEHLDYLDDEGVKSWLVVVSSNIAKDYLKRGGTVEIQYMDPFELSLQPKGYCESEEERLVREDKKKATLEFLWVACSVLYEKNPMWYYVLLDSCMLGMTSAQIAKVLNTSVGNIDVIKSRARLYLKKKLKHRYREFL